VGENGPEEFDINLLKGWSARTQHYTHARKDSSDRKKGLKKLKPPLRAALVSWVELLKLSGPEVAIYL
jgi:hypothetical protein